MNDRRPCNNCGKMTDDYERGSCEYCSREVCDKCNAGGYNAYLHGECRDDVLNEMISLYLRNKEGIEKMLEVQ
jgi:hypothetical protein